MPPVAEDTHRSAAERAPESAPKGARGTTRGATVRCAGPVAVWRRRQQVVHHPGGLQWDAGLIHGVTGPNGAGKSSLLATLLGLLPGTARVELPAQVPALASRALGYAPQQLHVDMALPLVVADLLGLLGAPASQHAALLAAAGLVPAEPDVTQATPGARAPTHTEPLARAAQQPLAALSVGQRQRLLVAAALWPRPALALLDEPTAGVDAVGAVAIATLLRAARDDGSTIVVVSHDSAWLTALADTHAALQPPPGATP